MTRYSLGSSERIKGRKLIGQIFSEGKRIVVTPFIAHYLFTPKRSTTEPGLLFGVTVSSRNFKKAVDRNRIKRLVREAYRLQKKELAGLMRTRPSTLSIFINYTGKELPDYDLVFEKLGIIIGKAGKLNDAKP